MLKLALYVVLTPIVIWSFESININSIFKKNRDLQARFVYMILIFSISYLFVNFVYDLIQVV